MTLVFLEGFDNFRDDAWVQARMDGFSPTQVTTVASLHGGRALASEAASGNVLTLIVPNDDEYTTGMLVRTRGTMDSGTGNMAITYRLAGQGDQFTLRFVEISAASPEWRIELRRGGLAGTVVATQTLAQHQDVWHYVEFQCLANTTTGAYEVRLDGTALAELTATGVNTANSGTNNIDRVDIALHQDAEMTDIYILNNATATNNDFLGRLHVEGILPDGAGNQTDWTPTAAPNWQTVNELGTGSLGTDYNESSTITETDLYNYANLTRIAGASVSIPGVELVSLMALSAAGTEDFHHVIRSGGMEHDATSIAVTSTSQDARSDVFETNLAESVAWNVADLNAVEFGVEKD